MTRPSTRTQVQTMKLDESQTQVASWVPAEGHLRVIGGAGSGKTGTLAMLVAKLVLVEGVSPESIYVTTFGNKAGGELIARLEPLIGTEHLAAMSVGTFHSLGRRALAALDTKAWAMARCLDLGAKQRGSGVPSSKMLWRSARDRQAVFAVRRSARLPHASRGAGACWWGDSHHGPDGHKLSGPGPGLDPGGRQQEGPEGLGLR